VSERRDWGADETSWMEQAIALAALGEGTTAPNPRVGCVVVRSGEVVGAGYHRAPGEPHAESCALRRAGGHAQGATLFINLEPCAHHGRTPPCSELLAASGIRRVVAAAIDPNPLVQGRGLGQLREAGVEVEVGLLGPEARRLNAPFYHWHAARRPLVTVKAALSLDGMLAGRGGASHWITAAPARRFAHRLRLRHDAVLVGAGTLRRDDPALTVRLPGVRAPRTRVVLAPTLAIDPGARLFRERPEGAPPPRIYVAEGVPEAAERSFQDRAEIVRVGASGGRLDLGAVLDDLGRLGVQSLLVEGGGRTLASFLDAGLADRAALFVSGKLLGARGGTPLVDRPSFEDPERAWRVEPEQWLALGEDRVLVGTVVAGPGIA
jgi:diaminohydroxyphosphoribosylaminopyrimidine deaminase/5-amino-6-(5-phosphoribosylamino)uracil reductase